MNWDLFAVAAPGLEPLVARELAALGLAAREQPGGASFRGGLAEAARANLWLRTASRVLLRVGTFDAPGRRELASRAARFDWAPFLARGAAIHVHATARKSRLYHTGLIAEVLHEALGTVAAERDAAAPELHVRLVDDRCTLSLDTSGELLHRRGYRQETSRAPLRETLAAGLLLWAGYDGALPFVDPMCGSGTLPIEAALVATRTAPGLQRSFALERFPSFDAAVLERLREEARLSRRPAPASISGTDVHAGALAAARRNAERAGVEAAIRFERTDAARLAAPAATGLLVTNPPYGRRVGGAEDVRSTDEALGALAVALRGPFRGWTRIVLASSRDVARRLGPPARTLRLDNGGIPVDALAYAPEPA